MRLDVGFTSEKSNDIDCYDVHLKKIGFKYCKDIFNGNIYVFKKKDITFNKIMERLNQKSWLKLQNIFTMNKETDALLALLVEPYFDETYEYLTNNYQNLSRKLLHCIKTRVLLPLLDPSILELHKSTIGSGVTVEGEDFYKSHCCFQKSNELISLLNQKNI